MLFSLFLCPGTGFPAFSAFAGGEISAKPALSPPAAAVSGLPDGENRALLSLSPPKPLNFPRFQLSLAEGFPRNPRFLRPRPLFPACSAEKNVLSPLFLRPSTGFAAFSAFASGGIPSKPAISPPAAAVSGLPGRGNRALLSFSPPAAPDFPRFHASLAEESPRNAGFLRQRPPFPACPAEEIVLFFLFLRPRYLISRVFSLRRRRDLRETRVFSARSHLKPQKKQRSCPSPEHSSALLRFPVISGFSTLITPAPTAHGFRAHLLSPQACPQSPASARSHAK